MPFINTGNHIRDLSIAEKMLKDAPKLLITDLINNRSEWLGAPNNSLPTIRTQFTRDLPHFEIINRITSTRPIKYILLRNYMYGDIADDIVLCTANEGNEISFDRGLPIFLVPYTQFTVVTEADATITAECTFLPVKLKDSLFEKTVLLTVQGRRYGLGSGHMKALNI